MFMCHSGNLPTVQVNGNSSQAQVGNLAAMMKQQMEFWRSTVSFSKVAKVLKFGIDHLHDFEDRSFTRSLKKFKMSLTTCHIHKFIYVQYL